VDKIDTANRGSVNSEMKVSKGESWLCQTGKKMLLITVNFLTVVGTTFDHDDDGMIWMTRFGARVFRFSFGSRGSTKREPLRKVAGREERETAAACRYFFLGIHGRIYHISHLTRAAVVEYQGSETAGTHEKQLTQITGILDHPP
jgi:hypothetical protein